MLTALYRKTVPKKVRDVIYQAFLGKFLSVFREFSENTKCTWYRCYYSIIPPKNAKEEAYKAWGIAGYSPYP